MWANGQDDVESARPPSLQDFTAEAMELRNVKSANIADIEKNLPRYAGQFLKIKFSHRTEIISKEEAVEMWAGRIYYWRSKRNEYGAIDVYVPKEGLQWFSRIPTHSDKRKTLFCYVRMDKGGADRALILGREIRTTAKGQNSYGSVFPGD